MNTSNTDFLYDDDEDSGCPEEKPSYVVPLKDIWVVTSQPGTRSFQPYLNRNNIKTFGIKIRVEYNQVKQVFFHIDLLGRVKMMLEICIHPLWAKYDYSIRQGKHYKDDPAYAHVVWVLSEEASKFSVAGSIVGLITYSPKYGFMTRVYRPLGKDNTSIRSIGFMFPRSFLEEPLLLQSFKFIR